MTSQFRISDTPFAGLKLLERKPAKDERGMLERIFCSEELETLTEGRMIVQINRTITAKCGAVRGLHFQYPPNAEMKFVSCLKGEIFDVAVDLRAGSPTFLKWHAEVLSSRTYKTMVIPEGFAHGFQSLTADCEILYLHTSLYHKESEGGLNANDPQLGIRWPIEISERSPRDSECPRLPQDFKGIVL